jgi:hypothetical protein
MARLFLLVSLVCASVGAYQSHDRPSLLHARRVGADALHWGVSESNRAVPERLLSLRGGSSQIFIKTLSGKTVTMPAAQALSYPVLAAPREGTAAVSGTSGALTVNLQTAGIFTLTPTGNVTGWTISNAPASGTLGAFVLRILGNGVAYTWVWPTTTKWAYGETPTPTSTNGKYDLISFFTFDGGTTWFAQVIGQNY